MSLDIEQFKKLVVIEKTINEFYAEKERINFDADKVVKAYIEKKLPRHFDANRRYQIDYQWGEDGISVFYDYVPSVRFGFSDDREHVEHELFRLKYIDVFGWECDWTKPICKLSEAILIAQDILKKVK